MTAIRLSDRETAALLALADLDRKAGGAELAGRMTENGRETSPAGAHQSGAGLARKGLAEKRVISWPTGSQIGYEITDEGRTAAASLRAKP